MSKQEQIDQLVSMVLRLGNRLSRMEHFLEELTKLDAETYGAKLAVFEEMRNTNDS